MKRCRRIHTKKIRKSLSFEKSGEEVYVEIGMKNVPPKIKTKTVVDFLKILFEEAIDQLEAPVIPGTEPKECARGLSTEDVKEAIEVGEKEFEKLMQEWLRKNRRAAFGADTIPDNGQGPDPDKELVSVLHGIKDILERIEGTSSATALEPGTVVNISSTEDIQSFCGLSREKFDQMIQDYEKRESRKMRVGRINGDVPEITISIIPCPPKKV